MFTIKICGITNIPDALIAAAAGADAIGLNFFPKSPRFISNDLAAGISSELSDRIARVGVFVNADVATIRTTARAAGLDWIQLHGDDRPERLTDLPASMRLICGFRLQSHDLTPVADYMHACQIAGRMPDAILLDVFDPIRYGGTGRTLAWEKLRGSQLAVFGRPILLAGGLTPDNVADAVRCAGPMVTGVDTASGVESSPGIKDPAKVRSFIARARAALESSRPTP
ncbi:MAG: phosphoribosylanthranilate isomerase [Pirellulales bacterium]|nr:phosphoribosylanthranilate isomerase [Pirellulales bacterium]